MPLQLHPATSPSMTRGASLLKWSFVFIILTGCASSSLEETKPQNETNKNYKSPSNNLTGSSEPAPRLPPTPENCSDHSQLGSVVCSENQQCHELSKECLNCDFNCNCVYGKEVNVTCKPRVSCKGRQEITVSMICRYCYQTSHWEHTCLGNNQCRAVHSPRETFTSNCTVNSDVLCLGNRVFRKKLYCNWTSGYKWSTALLLSITLGGFGADRFYLGHWQEGIGGKVRLAGRHGWIWLTSEPADLLSALQKQGVRASELLAGFTGQHFVHLPPGGKKGYRTRWSG